MSESEKRVSELAGKLGAIDGILGIMEIYLDISDDAELKNKLGELIKRARKHAQIWR